MVKNPLLITGISLITLLIFGWALIWPKYQDLNFLRKMIKEKKIELETITTYFNELREIFQELQKYQDSLSKIDQALPQNLFLPEILDFIQKGISQSGLLLKKIGPTTINLADWESEIREIKIDLSFSGDYPSFKDFLSFLEQSARLFEIEKISLSSGKEEINFDLIIKTHSY